jgi:hypothetical protein
MALTTFQAYDINGNVLKFVVDTNNNNELKLVTVIDNTTGLTIGNFPTSFNVGNFPTSFNIGNFPTVQTVQDNFSETVATVSVGTALTTLLTFDTRAFNYLSFEVNNGATPLAECQVQAKYADASNIWNPKTFGATEYTTGVGKQSGNNRISIIEASGNLNILAANASGWVEIDCSRYASVRLQARVTSGTSTVITRGVAKH